MGGKWFVRVTAGEPGAVELKLQIEFAPISISAGKIIVTAGARKHRSSSSPSTDHRRLAGPSPARHTDQDALEWG